MNPCNSTVRQIGCEAPKDRVPDELAAMGKTGQKFCGRATEFWRSCKLKHLLGVAAGKGRECCRTFRTLDYAVDRRGEAFVHVSRDIAPQYIVRDPYVARVGQDTGAYATITLNAGGAFFQTQAAALLGSKDGNSPESAARGDKHWALSGDSLAVKRLLCCTNSVMCSIFCG